METEKFAPDPLATWEEKKKDKYALAYANLISKEWFNGGMIDSTCEYANRRDWIINKRLVARGEQDTQKYKDHVARQEGDLNYLNLPWKIVNFPGKFCKVVYNGISDENYNLDIRANDRLTLQRKKDKMAEHRNNMRSLPLLKKTKQLLGIDLLPQGFIPQDEEELQLYSEIKDRPKIEIAEEILIDYIKKTNDYDFIEKSKNKDLVLIGISAERTWTDPIDGVKLQYVDPEFLVHSHVNRNDFSDAYYYGYLESITVDDIKRESGFDDKKIREIAKSYGTQNKRTHTWESCDIRELLDIKCDVLRFAFKTTKTTVFKQHKRKGETVKVSAKDENYNPPERSDYGKLESTKGTWMEGTHIVGTEYVYNYKECENIIRDEQNKPRSPFTVYATDIYKNRLHSFLDEIEPLSDELYHIHLKISHLTAELKPDLTIINEDALADLSGKGDKMATWKEALNLLNVKGVVIEKTVDMGEMGVSNKQGARPQATAQGSALTALLNLWAHYYNAIRDATGVNPARDGSLPHDALLGVNQMAQLSSNTVTKNIVDTAIAFNKDVCETISSRVHAIFKSKNASHLRKMYERAVGKQNIDALESMKDRHLHDFGFTVEMIPTQQELKEFKDDLLISLQEGLIDVEVKSEAQRIAKTNIKLANQYLFYMRKKRRKELMEEEAQKAKVKSQNDIQSAQVARQEEVQAYGIKTEMDLKKEAKMAEIRVYEKQATQQIEQPVKDDEFRKEVFLKQLDVASNFELNKFKEKAKDLRVSQQSTEQSKLIEQRQKDTGPVDFQNTNIFEGIFD